MPVDTLLAMAQRAATHRSRAITDFGSLPFELVAPILSKVDNAEQLHTIELNSPDFIGQTTSIWLTLIKRDIPDYLTRRHQPSDPANWYKVYRKLKRDSDADLLASQAALKAELNSQRSEKESKVTHIVNRNALPREAGSGVHKRQRIHYAYNSGMNGSKGANNLTLLEKIRREGRTGSSKKMSRPMHELNRGASGVKAAPRDFVEEVRLKVPSSVRAPHGVRSPSDVRVPNELRTPRRDEIRRDPKSTSRTNATFFGEAATPPAGLTAGFLEDDELDSPVEEKSKHFTLPSTSTQRIQQPPTKPPIAASSTAIKRVASPLPDMRKRKQVPTLFHSSPAKMRKN